MEIKILASTLVMFFAASCGPKEITPTSILHDKVMVIHDEVMPKMKEIYKLKKGLRKLNKASESETVTAAITNLTKADDAMMDWMAAYSKPKIHSEEAISYLDDQMKKISAVKTEMLTAIANAQTIIDEH